MPCRPRLKNSKNGAVRCAIIRSQTPAIEVILKHLEYQNAMLIAMVQKLGVNMEEAEGPSAPSKPPVP